MPAHEDVIGASAEALQDLFGDGSISQISSEGQGGGPWAHEP